MQVKKSSVKRISAKDSKENLRKYAAVTLVGSMKKAQEPISKKQAMAVLKIIDGIKMTGSMVVADLALKSHKDDPSKFPLAKAEIGQLNLADGKLSDGTELPDPRDYIGGDL